MLSLGRSGSGVVERAMNGILEDDGAWVEGVGVEGCAAVLGGRKTGRDLDLGLD